MMNNKIQEGHKPPATCEVPGAKAEHYMIPALRYHQEGGQTT